MIHSYSPQAAAGLVSLFENLSIILWFVDPGYRSRIAETSAGVCRSFLDHHQYRIDGIHTSQLHDGKNRDDQRRGADDGIGKAVTYLLLTCIGYIYLEPIFQMISKALMSPADVINPSLGIITSAVGRIKASRIITNQKFFPRKRNRDSRWGGSPADLFPYCGEAVRQHGSDRIFVCLCLELE